MYEVYRGKLYQLAVGKKSIYEILHYVALFVQYDR